MGEERNPQDREPGSIEGMAAARKRQREEEEKQPTLITLDVRQRADVEAPFMVASLKLKGELPLRRDLNDGDLLTVQVAGPDGGVLTSGIFEVGLPGFKHIKQKGAGIIGLERVHSAEFAADA